MIEDTTVKIYANDKAFSDYFGSSVSLFKDTALIGAYLEDGNGISDSGSVYVFTRISSSSSNEGSSVITTTWTQQTKLYASDAAASDRFGISVSLYEDTALIGAYYDDDKGTNTGSVYVFKKNISSDGLSTTWNQQLKLYAIDAAASDYFGTSVSLFGDTALIGAPYDDESGLTDSGSVYVFTRAANRWMQRTKLYASDAIASDYFGASVSLYGDTALIGAYGKDVNGKSNSGSVYVFTRISSSNQIESWTQRTKIFSSDGAAQDNFGFSVSLYGDTALIGASGDDGNGKTDSGAVYIFTRSSSSSSIESSSLKWTEQQKIYASDAAISDSFGSSVSLYGDMALISSREDDDNALTNSGSVYVFKAPSPPSPSPSSSSPSPALSPSPPPLFLQTMLEDTSVRVYASDAASNDYFGRSVSLYGDTALVGAYGDDDNEIADSGSVYVFTRSSSSGSDLRIWKEQTKLYAPYFTAAAASDYFGWSVSLFEDTAMIGSPNSELMGVPTDQGVVYVFTRNITPSKYTIWKFEKILYANDKAGSDYFGSSVSLFKDTALIGAYYDDDNEITDSGSVYVFTRISSSSSNEGSSVITTTWTQQTKLYASDAAASDRFGISVSLYEDTALIGAYYDDDNGISDSGSVYVFTRISSSSSNEGSSVITTTWEQQTKLYASDAAASDYFGTSVSLYGDTALIGAYYDDDNGISDSGSVYVFTRISSSSSNDGSSVITTTWTQQTKLYASDAAASDYFGISVSLYEDTALIGAYYDDDKGTNSGKIYVFKAPPPPPPLLPSPPLSFTDYIQSKSLYSHLEIENHVSGEHVYDTAVNISWSGASTQKPSIVVVDGKSCLNMDSTAYIQISPPLGYPALGQYYTQFYIWKSRTSDSSWRTLYLNYNIEGLTVVEFGTKNLGVWSNRNEGFHDSGYDIIVQWQVLIAVSEGDSATSSTGTTSFYINDDNGNAVLVGSSNRVGSGTPLDKFGRESQPPGYFIEAGILNEALDSTEIQELMSILVNKMEESSTSSSSQR